MTLGQTTRITCQGEILKRYYASWLQQKPGQAPTLLIYADKNRTSVIPDRFSVSDPEDKTILTLSGAQAEDEAEYHCAVWDSSGKAHGDPGRRGSETKTTDGATLSFSPKRSGDKAMTWSDSGPRSEIPRLPPPPSPQAALQGAGRSAFRAGKTGMSCGFKARV